LTSSTTPRRAKTFLQTELTVPLAWRVMKTTTTSRSTVKKENEAKRAMEKKASKATTMKMENE